VSTLIRLSFSAKWKFSRRLFVDDDSTMIMLINKLKICCIKFNKRFNKIKNDESDLKNSTDQCEFFQLVTRNVVIVNYVDAWVKWWIIFIKWLHNVLYKWFLISSYVKYFAHMLNTRFVT
jgi:hypothetical protein